MCNAILKASVFPDFEPVLQNIGFRRFFFSKDKLLSGLQKLLLRSVFWDMEGTV